MQDFLLGVLLFVVYFCAASCFRYKSALGTAHSETTTTTLDATQALDTNPSLQTHSSITPVNQASNPKRHINNESSFNPETEPLEPETTTELAQKTPTSAQLPINNTLHPAATVSLIKDLKLLEARKVASLLGIQQQVNGVKKPKEFLQREICQTFKVSPERVTNIVTEVVARAKTQTKSRQANQARRQPA
ncbi:MAG TPA: hypothetical protein V6D48_06070 [Oculatellaceae cyanobacterium]